MFPLMGILQSKNIFLDDVMFGVEILSKWSMHENLSENEDDNIEDWLKINSFGWCTA